jgi:4,5:9,10-diseco-3-hydroxy-5,9,17-trioxoandrosta-1(10),2-diene-4-oate hydrolase
MSEPMEANRAAERQWPPPDPQGAGVATGVVGRETVRLAETPRHAIGAVAGGPRVEARGVALAYDEVGTGLPVVCLHAIGHGASDFRALGRRLGMRSRVIAPDWPGHGRSDDDDVPPSALRYADVLGAFLDALGLERVVLVGNSIGGAAAIAYAASHPERVLGLVVENPGGLDPRDRLARQAVAAMVRFFAAGARGARWFPAAYRAYYRLVLQRSAASVQRRRITAAGREHAALLRDAWRSFGEPAADRRDDLHRIECPTLVAWATRDRIVQLRRALPALSRLRRTELLRFPAGHAAHLETPEAFGDALERFLDGLAGPSGGGTSSTA